MTIEETVAPELGESNLDVIEASTGEAAMDPTGASEADPLYEVTVNGQPQQVTLQELQAGYMMQSEKLCRKCDQILDKTKFSKDRSRSDGLQTYCKVCRKAESAQWRTENPEYRRTQGLAIYGLTPDDYQQMLEDQNYVCAICGGNPNPERWLCVDHNHETEEVRGLLCIGCNAGLGNFREDIDRMASAMCYLLRD